MNPYSIRSEEENSFEVPDSMSRDIKLTLKSSIDDHFNKLEDFDVVLP